MKEVYFFGKNVWVENGKKGHWLGKGHWWDFLSEKMVLELFEKKPSVQSSIKALKQNISSIYSPWDVSGDGKTWTAHAPGGVIFGRGDSLEEALEKLIEELTAHS